MSELPPGISNEMQAAAAFTAQAADFDDLYGTDEIIRYKRSRVREQVLRFLPPQSRILELNSGTGEDAIYFARLGHQVHATDISRGMQERLAEKVSNAGLRSISLELCSFTSLGNLQDKGPYDYIFSNFAGLNCTSELDKVLASFDSLLKPGGVVTLVLLPKFCLWEFLLLFKGKFATATRRFFSKNGRSARVNGLPFTCWYYAPSFVTRSIRGRFHSLSLEGLCTIVPPSYIEGFGEKYPRLFKTLKRLENLFKAQWPWRSIGDYYIISFKKK